MTESLQTNIYTLRTYHVYLRSMDLQMGTYMANSKEAAVRALFRDIGFEPEPEDLDEYEAREA